MSMSLWDKMVLLWVISGSSLPAIQPHPHDRGDGRVLACIHCYFGICMSMCMYMLGYC